MRLTLRTRLALLYGGAFLVAGACLVVVLYLLVRSHLQPAPAVRVIAPEAAPPGFVEPAPEGPDLLLGRVEQLFEDTLQSLLWQSALALAVTALVAVALGRLLAERALRPLAEVTSTARRVSDRGLHERIALDGPDDELKELADTVDGMLERLDTAFDGQRQFVANASHELRTPLAVTRTLLEVAVADPGCGDDVRRLAVPLLETNARSERLLEALLLLARAQSAVSTTTPVDLCDVVRCAVAAVTDEACARGLRLEDDVRGPAVVGGDAALLEQVALNLLQNAVRHNVPDGTVRVCCRGEGDDVLLVVENTGPVLSSYEVPALLEPFRRGRDRTVGDGGHGLGLPLVAAVARGHGALLDLHPRHGGGLVASYRQPVVRSR